MIGNKIAYGAIAIKSPASWTYMKEGDRLFHSSREVLLQHQDEQYQKLLLYANEHTRYYRRVFDDIALIRNGAIDQNRYGDIPMLTKEIIRREGGALISDEAMKRGAYANTSGGSTGEPIHFVQDKEYFACNFGDKILFGVLNGKLPGDKEIKLWGSERDILEGGIGYREKCVQHGQKVAIKPNLVRGEHPYGDAYMESMITHSSVIRPIIDYVLLATGGNVTIMVGDVPLQDCRWDDAVAKSGLRAPADFYAGENIEFDEQKEQIFLC